MTTAVLLTRPSSTDLGRSSRVRIERPHGQATLNPLSRLNFDAAISSAERPWGDQPSSMARGIARSVLRESLSCGLYPTRVVAASEGGVALVFEQHGRYADIECLNDGSVMAGLTNFAEISEVIEIEHSEESQVRDVCLSIKRFLD